MAAKKDASDTVRDRAALAVVGVQRRAEKKYLLGADIGLSGGAISFSQEAEPQNELHL
ncbi:hypothetical protein [Methylocella tundrae]|nr:hypothetical protein [Methylocella tundrae]